METDLQTLSSASCVVKANFPNSKLESSACGIIIDLSRGLVLSHGSLLTDCCTDNKLLSAKVRNGQLLRPQDLFGSNFSLFLSNQLLSLESFRNNENQNALVTMGTSSSFNKTETLDKTNDLPPPFTQAKCHFISGFRNNDFHKTMSKLMPNYAWTFNDIVTNSDDTNDNNNNDHGIEVKKELANDDSNDLTYHLLSYFLEFRINYSDLRTPKDSLVRSNPSCKYYSPLKRRKGKSFIGETAEIIATPFASLCPSVFFNGYSRGVISNVGGIDDCWIVTDARCIPGCEGGPLYTKKKPTDTDRFLSGIITSPLCWKNNEWVGFSVACSIDSILKSMAQHRDIISRASNWYLTSTRKQNRSHVKDLLKAQAMTVLIQSGNTWGTGVIVERDKGVILTCSHVVKGISPNSVTVTPSKSKIQHRGQVVYRQEPVRTAYDLAVINCPQATKHLPLGWCVNIAEAFVGEDIILSGHAVFSTDRHVEPSICQGVVSKVIKSGNQPAMLQTTCAVHAGSSGGPLLTSDCCLVGIVVCNTRDSASNTSFPHVNLCIPISTVWPVINDYLSFGNTEGLSKLQIEDVELNQLWTLGSQTSHETEGVMQRSKL